ncbi:MAG: hypothetical protein WCQ78_04705 [Actinomycetes bacterium]|jgi:hypothetical protein
MTSTIDSVRSKAVKGPGLKTAGIIILQFLFIFLIEALEYEVTKVGRITGIALILCSIGGLYLGRTGTSLVNAVNPPIALLIATLFIMSLLGGAGLHATKIGLDLVTSLAGVAPYLITATLIGWAGHFAKSKSKAKS